MTRPSPNPSPPPSNPGLLAAITIISIIVGLIADAADILDRFKGLFPTQTSDNSTPVALPSPTRENQTATNADNATPSQTQKTRPTRNSISTANNFT